MVNLEGLQADGFLDSDSAFMCTAETAECGCPDRCDRDHGNE
jgi:hypothetical protein